MRFFVRLLGIAVLAGAGLAAALLLLARPADTLLSATRANDVTDDLQLSELSLRSVVYDRNGGVLAILHADENRSPVPVEQVPDHVVEAILDVEDESFWAHDGINVRSILRAALTNVRSGEIRQGGSTITQQLVKNSLLTPKRDLERKVKEAVLAVRLEQKLDKREILESYLNTVYFGNGAYGVQAAAETYFGVGVSHLTVGQGAFLAGLIRNPVGYDPFRYPELSRDRRDFVLDRMVTTGHLEPREAEDLKQEPLPAQKFDAVPTRDDYFVEEVKQSLLDDPRLGETAQERYNAVFRGGLHIRTTFDPRLQMLAQDAVTRLTPDTGGRFTTALVTVEPLNGAVRAMVGGPGWEQAKYNLATGRGGSGRQPGSSWKPFVLTAAFENGVGPNDRVNGSSPCTFPAELTGTGESYRPQNYEGTRGGWGTVAQATARSLNCAFVRLGLSLDDQWQVSLQKVADTAKRLGIGGQVDPVLAMSLGSEEVTPLQMASAYAVFANDGIRHEPYFIERVTDRAGRDVIRRFSPGEQVISRQHARMVTQVLEGVVRSGTGTRARIRGRDVAGKTGTSQEWRDAWFVGYTPQLATAVWMGSPAGQIPMRNVGGVRVTGGSYPARIWGAYMTAALEMEPPAPFPDPDSKLIPRAKTIRDKWSKGSRYDDDSRYTKRSRRRTRSSATTRRSTTRATTATTTAPTQSDTTDSQDTTDTTSSSPPTTSDDSGTRSPPPDDSDTSSGDTTTDSGSSGTAETTSGGDP